MKVFVINLDRDTAKLASIDAQLKRLGVDYTRVAGVYGRDLPPKEYEAAYDHFGWWCAVGLKVQPGEIGCALSHYSIYRQMTEPVCILEDDVILDDAFVARLEEVGKFLDPDNPQVVLLSSHEHPRMGAGVVRSDDGMCTDGYVLTVPAAKAILRDNLPLRVPCDIWRRWVKRGLIELYHALPTVVSQDQATFGGSTQMGIPRVSSFPLPKYVWHKFKRVIGVTLDNLMFMMKKGAML